MLILSFFVLAWGGKAVRGERRASPQPNTPHLAAWTQGRPRLVEGFGGRGVSSEASGVLFRTLGVGGAVPGVRTRPLHGPGVGAGTALEDKILFTATAGPGAGERRETVICRLGGLN